METAWQEKGHRRIHLYPTDKATFSCPSNCGVTPVNTELYYARTNCRRSTTDTTPALGDKVVLVFSPCIARGSSCSATASRTDGVRSGTGNESGPSTFRLCSSAESLNFECVIGGVP